MIFCYTHKLEPSPVIIRKSHQELMEEDSETNSQIFGRAWGVL